MKIQKSKISATTVILFAFYVASCATTSMTSQRNPETIGRNISRVLVNSGFQSIEHRNLAEKTICSELMQVSYVECFSSDMLFFPGEEYTPEQWVEKVQKWNIDAVLFLSPLGSGTTSSYIPQTSQTTGTASVFGNTVNTSSTTQTYGGYTVEKPWAKYELKLMSVGDGRVIWYASASSQGDAFTNWDNLINSAAKKTSKQLVQDGVVPLR